MNIKKTALALGSAIMLFATTLNAQEQPWSFGVKGGASMSWLRGLDELKPTKINNKDVNHEASGRIFASGGLTAGYAFHENVGVGLELLYAGLGGELKTSEKTASTTNKNADKPDKLRIHSHNIVVPVMLKLFPMGCDPDEGILTVDLGVQGVLPISVSVERSKSKKDTEELEEFKDSKKKGFDKSAQVSPFTVDAIAGVGYEFPEIGLTLEGRYHFGFMNFFKSENEAKDYRAKEMKLEKDKNLSGHYATLSLGYNFARLLMD